MSDYFSGIKLNTMSPIEEEVVRKGLCPKCVTRSLKFVGGARQCRRCSQVFVTEEIYDQIAKAASPSAGVDDN